MSFQTPRELSEARRIVLWSGRAPTGSEERELQNRELEVVRRFAADDIRTTLFQARAWVICYDSHKPVPARRLISELWKKALDHGVKVVVLADDAGFHDATDYLGRLSIDRHVAGLLRASKDPAEKIAESIARHSPGPLFRNLEIELLTTEGKRRVTATDTTVGPDAQLLLKRSFGDCEKIEIRKLTGGFSALALEVYAVRTGAAGPRLLPFFAKLDVLHKIANERQNYLLQVENYIPFAHRPRLDEDRCLLGSSTGILVGDFVERSEPFIDVAKRDAGHVPLHSLVHDALRGWHLQAYVDAKPQRASLVESLSGCFDAARMERERKERLASANKIEPCRDPQSIARQLEQMPPTLHRRCFIHGDLHVGNVRVRGRDAILIDFNSARYGPMLADLAALEVSVVFDSYGLEPAENLPAQWQLVRDGWEGVVKTLFEVRCFELAPPPSVDPTARAWLWNTVRSLRLLALGGQTTAHEYMTLVAVYLLRHAMVADAAGPQHEHRYVFAYVLADRLLRQIMSGGATNA